VTPEPDTIVALATPPGRGAVALVRLSGPNATQIFKRVAPRWRGGSKPRCVFLTRVLDSDGGLLDRVLVTFFQAPASYTGEDLVEISTHGGAFVPARVIGALETAGARLARAGEFTQRAYLNGKLDLVQAEAVRDLVDAQSAAMGRAAVHQIEGGLSRRLAAIRERLVGLEALLAHHIDFPDEDEPPTPVEDIVARGRDVARALRELLGTAEEGELLRSGALVVIAGRPNAGKSSVFNALVGRERAIVTPEPGTTRDALEAQVSFYGYPFRLVDTAGIREDAGNVERLGIEVARRYLRGADVVLLCASAEWGWGAEEDRFLSTLHADTPVVVLRTKADLGEPPDDAAGLLRRSSGDGDLQDRIKAVLSVSVVSGTGLDEVKSVLKDLVFRGLASAEGSFHLILTGRRQSEGVRRAMQEVEAFVEALERGVPAEMAATHLRPAESALEELIGVIRPDDVLERVFADFCIGK
jgi:tRNA modification GTPase